MNCSIFRVAKKINTLKLAQQAGGQPAATHRQPALETSALCFLPQRPPRLKIAPQKRRLPVMIDPATEAQIPQQVKIIHLG
jgi:hypothetical protein